MSENIIIRNGYVYKTRSCWEITIIYLCNNRFGILSVSRHVDGWPISAPMFQTTKTGLWQFTEHQLYRWLKTTGAIRVKKYLHIVEEEHASLL